jgi:hypothetical protein
MKVHPIRFSLHATICMVAILPWLIGVFGFYIALWFGILADKVWPNATWGNCWTHAGPLWHRRGGYLCIRWADSQLILGRWRIPHSFHIDTFPEDKVGLTQAVPTYPKQFRLYPYYVLYHHIEVVHNERPHNSAWTSLTEE